MTHDLAFARRQGGVATGQLLPPFAMLAVDPGDLRETAVLLREEGQTAIYLVVFTAYFLWHEHKSKGFWKTALFVAVFSVTTAAAVSALFRYGFLVRLP